MQYLLLLYADETLAAKIPAAELGQAFAELAQVTEDLKKRGLLRSSNPLGPTASATTVRVREGKRTLTDGPFAETKEQLGGYFLIEAANLDEAVAVAARLPTSRYGCIEIRPVMMVHR